MSEKRDEPLWIVALVVHAIHADQMREHGGSLGTRDAGLLESALDRARNRWHYEDDSDLASLASAYGFGIARNHPFVDGNKRTAFQVMYVFLGLNDFRITAPEAEVVALIIDLASGAIDEAALAARLRSHIKPR